jgi:D-beta-D-heptose 7-phosphate kinase/D-beta-D-heptose 1-phosphate adenosyltransferase
MDYNRLFELGEKKILVIGDIMLDIYQYGKCNRISPEAPVQIIEFTSDEKMIGGAGNVLKNLVSFGANCEIISVVGDDTAGCIILEKLKELNIKNQALVIDDKRRTTEKCRIVSGGQQLIRIDKEDKHPISNEIEEKIISYVKKNIQKYDIILFSDYSKGVLTDKVCGELIALARKNNVISLVDPKGSNYKKYKSIDLIKPNLKEAEILIENKIHSKEEIKAACIKLKELLGCKYVVITLAENGIGLYENNFEIIPTKSCQVFDVSGAGDTVLASLAVCLKQNFTLFDACDFSNKAASVVIRKFGSTTTTIQEIMNSN